MVAKIESPANKHRSSERGIEFTQGDFPGIGTHLDVSSYDDDGSLEFHTSFAEGTTPKEAREMLLALADGIERTPPESMTSEEAADSANRIRRSLGIKIKR